MTKAMQSEKLREVIEKNSVGLRKALTGSQHDFEVPTVEFGGTKYDGDKLRHELIPVAARNGLARVLTFGALKYDAHNWRKGIVYSRVIAALHRHLAAFEDGEDLDPESGFSHIDHLLCNAAFLATFISEKRDELDDRYKGDIK